MTLTQKIKSGNESENNQAGRDLIKINGDGNYVRLVAKEERDFAIIDEIFNSVIKQLGSSDKEMSDKGYLEPEEKIKLNFPNDSDGDVVRQYFKYALGKVYLIDRRIKEEESDIQHDLHNHIFGKYRALKTQNKENIQILEELIEQFVIPCKKNNCQYTNLAKAFVLFFFEDCTIFEKTKTEK